MARRLAVTAALGFAVLLISACRMAAPPADPELATSGGTELAQSGDTPGLAVADARAGEADGMLDFRVSLGVAAGGPVTVDYATEDGSATAGDDYQAVSGALSFPSGITMATIGVPVIDDEVAEQTESLVLRLSNAQGAAVTDASATGTIIDNETQTVSADPSPPELASLLVSGGRGMYPPFDPSILHYALICTDSTELQVTAHARSSRATVTLLRADPDQNLTATGAVNARLVVDKNHDVAIRLSDEGKTVTYVIHCLPAKFPRMEVTKVLPEVSDGVLFLTPRYTIDGRNSRAVVDNNGVPRFHEIRTSINFRRWSNGPTVDGKVVKYTMSKHLLDADFNQFRTVDVVAPLTSSNPHDFLVTDRGFLLMSYHPKTRDLSQVDDSLPSNGKVRDAVIQEVSVTGEKLFQWNSWNHLVFKKQDVGVNEVVPDDCRLREKHENGSDDYAHLNSLQMVDDGIIASFRGCAQVLRINRSSGAVEWKLGGTPKTVDPDTQYLTITNDPAGELCGMHQATLTDTNTVVMFDNGTECRGPRKTETPFTRVVEYDISSGTHAEFKRQYIRPANQGYSPSKGGVTVLNNDTDPTNDRWLITWGSTKGQTAARRDIVAITEYDPNTQTVLFEMNMYGAGQLVQSYRVYREPEHEVPIPLNLP